MFCMRVMVGVIILYDHVDLDVDDDDDGGGGGINIWVSILTLTGMLFELIL